ncbi:MAG: Gfo/Idh/MocA family oxidoreductase [Bryobacteraceae bacterium]
MNRRMFLATAAAAQAAPARIRIAFLGGTHSHAFAKASICKTSPDWDLAGVWEEDPQARKRYEQAGIPLISQQQALDKTIRVVAVESEVRDHQSQAQMALEAGKHVHVEKPPAHTLDGMRTLVKLARAKNLLLQPGYMWRYHPAINTVLEAARKGWLGEVYMIRGQINTLISGDQRRELGRFKGGQMFELGPHLIDPIVRLLGRPQKVTPFLHRQGSIPDALNDNTVAVLEYPRAMAVIQSSTLQPGASGHRSFEVLGTNGTAMVRPIEPATLEIDLAKAAGPYKQGRQTIPLPPYKRYVDDLVELAAAVRGEKKLSVSLDEEMLVEEVVLAASGQI